MTATRTQRGSGNDLQHFHTKETILCSDSSQIRIVPPKPSCSPCADQTLCWVQGELSRSKDPEMVGFCRRQKLADQVAWRCRSIAVPSLDAGCLRFGSALRFHPHCAVWDIVTHPSVFIQDCHRHREPIWLPSAPASAPGPSLNGRARGHKGPFSECLPAGECRSGRRD